MGQKKVIKKTEEETLKETEKLESAMAKTASIAKGKRVSETKGKIGIGRIYINASYNNTLFAATDEKGNVLAWASAGSLGFSGPKKATPFASSRVVSIMADKLKKMGFSDIEIIVKGIGSGRDGAIKALAGQGFNILAIKDMTPVPHNGSKPPKARRV